ncbi:MULTISPECIES: cell division protein ZapD [unclassified Pusillimonas]|uniref:cell division protein ZapD n=1 Tax=unclassified Pusillimonas TaxID=2640016 RepID=UPI000B9D33D8|nr:MULTISPECIES: cell division protein ZapD [unclassified Pusillimonas]OXR50798.1 cell division protein ZapD [Pusillimonas sp. T2]ROT44857.1 cell division protein ZapD [Pusillimonas sp. NJUB218]
MILYEYPCNERVRSLLRVEHLFGRLFFFANQEDVNHHQVAMSTLFDLLEVCERTDLRGSVLQDLERQRAALGGLRQHPGVDVETVDKMLADIERASAELAAQGRIGQVLRDNEWLASLRGRLTVPGGSSPADIPSYYAWQIKPTQVRMSDLQQWVDPFMPLYNGLALILRLLRESGNPVELEAPQGAYQEMLTGKTFQLLRVWVDPALGVFPEMSANKYVIWVRFSMQDNELKPISVTQRVPFRLSRCNF